MIKDLNQLRSFFKRWPRFYYFVGTVFGPMMFTGLSSRKFLKRYPSGGQVVNMGSGPRIIDRKTVNIDLVAYKNVHLLGDAKTLPLLSDSVDRLICETVLEHVENVDLVINEMRRVLKKQGLVYITVPFLYPYHDSPNDFTRWTKQGFLGLLKDFEIVESGIYAGAFSALTVNLVYLFAVIFSFGNRGFYLLLLNITMFIFWPIKLLDFIFARFSVAQDSAAVMYYVARKK